MISINTKKVREAKEARKKAGKPKITIKKYVPKEVNTKITIIPEQKEESQPNDDNKGNNLLHELESELSAIKRQRGKLSSAIYQHVYGKSSDLAIDIGTVLNKIDNTVDDDSLEVKTFGLRFLTDKGISELIDCRKNVRDPFKGKQTAKHQLPAKGKFKYNLKRKGTILLTSHLKDYRSVLVSAIYEFKDFKSNRWLRVKH